MTGKTVTFTADETRRAVMKSITLATGTLVEPTAPVSTSATLWATWSPPSWIRSMCKT